MKATKDPFPRYPPAGLHVDTGDQTALKAIFPEPVRAETPEHIRKYRKSFKQRHGVAIQHYGLVGDQLPGEEHRYGIVQEPGFHTDQVLDNEASKGIRGFVNEVKESKYDSLKKGPLGKPIDREYHYPKEVVEDKFKFGVATETNKFSCKEILNPGVHMEETDEVRKMYLRSHKNYAPAQQVSRDYKWPVDPSDFRFGKVEKGTEDIVHAMKPDNPTQSFPATKLITKNQADFANFKHDLLGKPSNLGQANSYVNEYTTYGKPLDKGDWGVGHCLRGEATLGASLPDPDLGRSVRQGFKNETKPGDENRLFGVPSVRLDIKPPENVSIADNQNYGTDPSAIELLYPESYQFMNLTKEDFDMRRPKEQIRSIFSRIGHTFSAGKFEAIFEKAKELEGTILDKVSCRSFLKAMQVFDQK